MNEFDKKYEELNDILKKAVNAYRSGRQFKAVGIKTSSFLNNPPTLIASIVNEIFACELFFKSMLMIKERKIIEGHKLLYFYNSLDDNRIAKILDKYNVKKEMKKINNSYKIWRYNYECRYLVINLRFIIDLCSALEELNKTVILEELGLNMNESFI